MILVVGATGLLGGEICRRLAYSGHAVRALVRRTSSPERLAMLERLGAQLVFGDLKDPASLRDACRDVDVVLSTASSTIARQEGDSIETVDRQGQLDLIEAAERAGVRRFVLISFPGSAISFPLQDAKREVEERLRLGGMPYVILQPTCFMEIWLSPLLGFDLANGRAQLLGSGRNPVSWISFLDVAACAVAAVHAQGGTSGTLRLGGPEALSALDVVRIAEQLRGSEMTVQHLPEDALRSQLSAATDPLQKSMAGLMLYCARGDTIDSTLAERVLGVRPQRSVREFLEGQAAS